MKRKTIKLTSEFSGETAYFNLKRTSFFVENSEKVDVSTVDVGGDGFLIEVKEPLDEVGKAVSDFGFIEFIRTSSMERLLIRASMIAEWHEQGEGVFLQVIGGGFIVQGTLEEVTARIEKALEEDA